MAKLYFRYGTMNSGKSTALIQVAHNYKERGFKVITIKPETDTKGSNTIVSRIGASLFVNYVVPSHITPLDVYLPFDCDCILVDEAQFLTKSQIDDLHRIAHTKNIPVICYGIRTDFCMNGFEGSSRLLEIADTIEEMKTICPHCGKKAAINLRLVNKQATFTGNQVEIDNQKSIEYIPVCSEYFYQLQKEKEETE